MIGNGDLPPGLKANSGLVSQCEEYLAAPGVWQIKPASTTCVLRTVLMQPQHANKAAVGRADGRAAVKSDLNFFAFTRR
jgi:hypothetical protein